MLASNHGEGLQEQSAERVAPVVDGCADAEQDTPAGQPSEDLVGLGHVAGEPVELGDGEHRPVPDGGEGLVEAGAVAAGGAGEAAVDVDAVGGDAEREQLLGLDLDVLLIGAATGISDAAGLGHACKCSV